VVVDLTEHLVALGTTGVAGPQDNPGSDGVAGAESPARVIWVADDATGDDPKLSAALTAALTAIDGTLTQRPQQTFTSSRSHPATTSKLHLSH
jgi:hypothetical protein